jgi:carbon storage regulator
MLVLSRRLGEEIIINDNIRVKVVAIQGNRVKLGFVAPEEVTVHREEIHHQRLEFADAPSMAGEELAVH